MELRLNNLLNYNPWLTYPFRKPLESEENRLARDNGEHITSMLKCRFKCSRSHDRTIYKQFQSPCF